MNKKHLYLFISLGILILGVWHLAPHKDREPVFANLLLTVNYVGDEECAACHPDIYNSYQRTGMGRSFYPASGSSVIEDYVSMVKVYDKHKNLFYTASWDDGEHAQTEFRLNDEGDRIHELTKKADHIIGSGNHNRSYLSETNGFVTQLPLTWYNDKQKWDLSPGYHTTNMRFSRPIIEECMHCHNSFSPVISTTQDRFEGDLPHGIGCERCHGPGGLHVSQRMDNVPIPDGVDISIVNPKHLPFQEQLDVCQQCHLQGEISIFRHGYNSASFRPGMQLASIKSIFMNSVQDSSQFRIASHAERLTRSACFKESNAMTCITCHNPHVSVNETNDDHFNQTCLLCHSKQSLSKNIHESNNNCVKCHMVQGGTSDIPHVNFTDHKIQIHYKDPIRSNPAEMVRSRKTVELKNYFPIDDPLGLAIAYVKYYESRHQDRAYLFNALEILNDHLKHQNTDVFGWYYFGRAYQLLGDNFKAEDAFLTLLDNDSDHYLANGQMGLISMEKDDFTAAITFYKKCIQIDKNDPLIWNNLGRSLLFSGDKQNALHAFSTALSINPHYTSALNNRGELLLYHLNDWEAGETDLLTCLQNDPDHVLALHNLSNAAILVNDLELAENYAVRAMQADRFFLPPYGTLSTIYQKTGRLDEARSVLSEMLAIDPDNWDARKILDSLLD